MTITKEDLIKSVIADAEALKYGDGKRDSFKKRTLMIVAKIFGENSNYVDTVQKIRFTLNPPYTNATLADNVSAFNNGRKQMINSLKVMLEDLELSKVLNNDVRFEELTVTNSKKVFIVHGQNEEIKQTVARFVEKIDYEPIILHDQPNKGRTIIEKFSDYSDVSFAIVLLTADDLGYSKTSNNTNAKSRARQNVIFELGYFLGKIGRERVIVLYQNDTDFEFPSDYQGVIYIPIDSGGHWKLSILKEMKAIGLNVDANRLL